MIHIEKEQKNIFFTSVEWEFLINLAFEANLPIGNFLIRLAHAEQARMKETNE